jgi:chromosomal replication initiation ATPase DnaA
MISALSTSLIDAHAVSAIIGIAEEQISNIVGTRIKLIQQMDDNAAKVQGLHDKAEELKQIVLQETSLYWKQIISWRQVQSSSRKKPIVTARHLYCYYAKFSLQRTLTAIGQELGERDHSTALHSIQTVKDLLSVKDDMFITLIARINKKLIENEI